MQGISELTGTEKAAALFLIMGKESAVRLADFFSKDELNTVVEAARGMSALSNSTINELIKEFAKNYQVFGVMANSDDLTKLFQSDETPETQKKVEPLGSDNPELDPLIIKEFLESEAPQIGALLLDRLSDETIVEVCTDLDPVLRNDIFHAYLTGNAIDLDFRDLLNNDLIDLVQDTKRDEGNTREVAKAGGLINQFSSDISDQIVGFLQGNNPELATAIKKILFKFSAISLLSKEDRSALFDGILAEEIVKALSTADEANHEAVFDVLSPRNRRLVESELARNVTPGEEAEKAQKAIVVRALALARDGEINLPETD